MTYQYLSSETAAERLLLVQIEQPQWGGSDYGHIIATVIRRAVSHTVNENGSVSHYNDAANATGYRNCGWNKTTTGAHYVEDMQLRGQFDKTPHPTRDGAPYGNKMRFEPYEVTTNSVVGMASTLTKWDKYCEKHAVNSYDNYLEKLVLLANFLRIDKLVFSNFPNPGSFDNKENFTELSVPMGLVRVQEMLAPYANKPPVLNGANPA